MINKTIKKNNKNNKNIKRQKYKLKKKTLKGGNCNTNSKNENFEVRSLNDFDYERYRVSKYINANIEWGSMPGPPPQPDCCIL